MSKEVTIIIPTKNRFKFLEKNINYYIQNQFKGKILILDSSSYSESKKISKFIVSCKKKICIDYYHKKALPNQMIKFFIKKIKTKFSIIGADDDFYIPSTISDLIFSLKKKKNFKIVVGIVLRLDFIDKRRHVNPFHEINISNKNNLFSRIEHYLNNYLSIAAISIIETKLLIRLFDYVPDTKNLKKCPIQSVSNEILITSLMILSSKILKSEKLLTVRMIHGNNSSLPKNHKQQDINESINYYLASIKKYLIENKDFILSKKNIQKIDRILFLSLSKQKKLNFYDTQKNKIIPLMKMIIMKNKFTQKLFYFLKKRDNEIDQYIINKNIFYNELNCINKFIIK